MNTSKTRAVTQYFATDQLERSLLENSDTNMNIAGQSIFARYGSVATYLRRAEFELPQHITRDATFVQSYHKNKTDKSENNTKH